MRTTLLAVLTVLALVAFAATPAHAAITASGSVISVQAAPTGTLNGNTVASNTSIFVWFERTTTLGSGFGADHDGSTGTFTTTGSLTAGTIAAGTRVSSYYVHFDQANTTGSTVLSNAAQQFITFDQQILGIELLTGTFNGGAGDTAFSPAGLTYGTLQARGLELGGGGNGDRFAIASGGGSWTLTLTRLRVVNGGVDSIRIITAAPLATPEPGTWALFGLGALGLGAYVLRRRKRCLPAETEDADATTT